jgi:hypothetical protein
MASLPRSLLVSLSTLPPGLDGADWSPPNEFGERFLSHARELLKARGLGGLDGIRAYAAAVADGNFREVLDCENGFRSPSESYRIRAAEFFGLPVDEVFSVLRLA